MGTLPTRGTGVERREGDVTATFIHKHKFVDRQVADQVTPGGTICFAPLGGKERLFLRVQPKRRMARRIVAMLTCCPEAAAHS